MLGTLNQTEMEAILYDHFLGRIACRDGNEIYIVPITYCYKDGVVICHSYEGRKLHMMRNTPEVGFEVEEINDHQHWKCIHARGLFEEITDPMKLAEAKQLLSESALNRKASLSSLPPAETASGGITRPHGPSVFFHIRLFNLTGRFENALS